MLIEFSVGNYRSFFQPVTLSMLAAKLRSQQKDLDSNNVFMENGIECLRSAAIYGANASGKSNLINAMWFFKRLILESSKESQAGEPIDTEPFLLSPESKQQPSYFQIIFMLEGIKYRYGFELNKKEIIAEWLYRTVKKEAYLFIRDKGEFKISNAFKEGRNLKSNTRTNALFISVVAQLNGPLCVKLIKWFRSGFNVISGLHDQSYLDYTTVNFETDEIFRNKVISLMRLADTGIENIFIDKRSLQEIPEELRNLIESAISRSSKSAVTPADISVNRIKTTHSVYDSNQNKVDAMHFDMSSQESEGTQKLFNLSGPIIDTLNRGSILVIDEMEARLHPFLTEAIIHLFNSVNINKHNAQLIFASHCTHVLHSKLFRRDQIWFTEKDRYGVTDLFSLAELKVRNDASFGKDYLEGKYGAVPYSAGLASFMSGGEDEETG